MKCPHCHKDIRPTDHFCPHCGYDLRRNPPRSTTILGRMMKGYLVIMLLTIALPMAIVFYSQFFTGKSITSNFQQSKLYELGELNQKEKKSITLILLAHLRRNFLMLKHSSNLLRLIRNHQKNSMVRHLLLLMIILFIPTMISIQLLHVRHL